MARISQSQAPNVATGPRLHLVSSCVWNIARLTRSDKLRDGTEMKTFVFAAMAASSLFVSVNSSASEPCLNVTNVWICDKENFVTGEKRQDEFRFEQSETALKIIEDEYQDGGNSLTFKINGSTTLWEPNSKGKYIPVPVRSTCDSTSLTRVYHYQTGDVVGTIKKTEEGLEEVEMKNGTMLTRSVCRIPKT